MFLFLFLVFFFFYLYTMNKRYIHIHAWQLLNKIIKILKSGSTKTTGTNYCICWSCFQSHSPPSLLFFFFFQRKLFPLFWLLDSFKGKSTLLFPETHFIFVFLLSLLHCFPHITDFYHYHENFRNHSFHCSLSLWWFFTSVDETLSTKSNFVYL